MRVVYINEDSITYTIYEDDEWYNCIQKQTGKVMFYNYNRRRESLSSENENFYLYFFHVYERHFFRKYLCIFFFGNFERWERFESLNQ